MTPDDPSPRAIELENSPAGENPRETHRLAVAALVCAGLGFSFFPLFGIALGFIFALRAERQIQADPERYQGLEMVMWARRLAWLGVFLVVISVVVVFWAWRNMEG